MINKKEIKYKYGKKLPLVSSRFIIFFESSSIYVFTNNM